LSFIAPDLLWVLLVLPAAFFAYVYAQYRGKPAVARYPGLGFVSVASAQRWRRHLPFGLFALALAAIGMALARPTAVIALPAMFDTVLLAIDVSGSMGATDIEPNRLAAAQAAARTFVAGQPAHTRIGLIAFGERAGVVQQPTQDRAEIRAAIDLLHLKSGTAVGAGIIVALATLFPDAQISPENPRGIVAPAEIDQRSVSGKEAGVPVPPASVTSAAIILLTDGESTSGPTVSEAAHAAADRGVRVFTVGIGTAEGAIVAFEGWRSRVRLDEDALREVASLTGAEYFQAQSAGELKRIYQTLSAQLAIEKKDTEITALFAAAAALLAILSAGFSLLWFNRIL
jgi:Ca-activated chloride channel family protein